MGPARQPVQPAEVQQQRCSRPDCGLVWQFSMPQPEQSCTPKAYHPKEARTNRTRVNRVGCEDHRGRSGGGWHGRCTNCKSVEQVEFWWPCCSAVGMDAPGCKPMDHLWVPEWVQQSLRTD